MLNTLPLKPQVRNPRAIIKINDIVVRKIDSWEYIENNYYQPDSFHVELPLYNLAAGVDVNYWLSQPSILIEIFAGFPNDPVNYGIADLQSLILGGINDLDVRVFDNGGGFVTFNGFDLSKKLIDTKTYDKFPNQTASQIATNFATQQGLTPVVTQTTTLVGYYYTQDYVQLGSAITQWDLLTYLAQREGFQVFVKGTKLFFAPRPTEQHSNPYVLQATLPSVGGAGAQFNGTQLIVSRNLNFAGDVVVRVRSWNADKGNVNVEARVKKTRGATVAASAGIIAQPQFFDYLIPGLSQQQAIERAQQLAENITLHERVLQAMMPADDLLHKDVVVQLQGVSTDADQIYFPDTITRRMGQGVGYSMHLIAKNHSPQTTVLA